MKEVLKLNNVSKKYGTQLALDNVSMTVHEGDIYGFVGENGAGKTTVIRAVTGLISTTSGDFDLFGVSSNSKDIYKARKQIQAVVESPSIYMNMTAKENLVLQMKLLGINDFHKIDDVLDTVGLSNIKDSPKKVSNFSLGMRQRLGIAISLIGDPKLLILDEPTNGLDPEGIVDMRELLVKINKEKNITMIVSSHILGELEKFATTFGFIHKGRIVKEISKKELVDSFEKGTILTLDNTEKLEEALKDFVSYKVKGNKILIKGDFNVTDVVLKLKDANINVLAVKSQDTSIENYYMRLIGGHTNA